MEYGKVVNGRVKSRQGFSFDKIKWALLLIIVALIVFDSFYTINEQEQAVVTTFGKANAVTSSGLHFKIPFIQQVKKVDTTIKGITIGYDRDNQVVDSEGIMITSDYNFVNVDFYLEYRFSDPIKALYASQKPVEILKNIAQSGIRSVIGQYTVDSVITTGKAEIQAAIRQKIVEDLEKNDIGIQLVNITIQDAEPPTSQVMEAFKAVETAKQGKETAINNANKYANEKLPEAEAKVDQIEKDAEAAKTARINEAEAQVAMFNAMYAEYIKNPEVTRQRMFYEAMENILPGTKIIIDYGNGNLSTVLPLDSFTTNPNTNNTGNTQEQ